MGLLEVRTAHADGAARIALAGELDIASAPDVEAAFGRLEGSDPPTLIVLDLRELEFMDSTGLRTVVAADTRAREQDRRFEIVRGSDAVHRIFSVTGLDERLVFVDPPAQ
ncbi:MAG TPA: STAS domain-containing protein [Solirubrobacteraceae bacterium]|jgi:anti-anti-sigma factor